MIYEKGTLVRSLAGRDKGEYFVIIRDEQEYVSLVDGKFRTINKPKMKNKKHLQIIHDDQEKRRKELFQEQVTDVQIRRFIQTVVKQNAVK